MTLLRFSGVGREFGARWVLRDVSFGVSADERWGIVGRNGTGKTTLLGLITGDDFPSEGEIWRHPGVRFSLLRQQGGETSEQSVRDAALEPFAELIRLEGEIERRTAALADADPESDAGTRLLHAYDRDLEEFRRRGGYEMRARADAALEGLGFPPETWGKPVRALSGGELGRLRLVQTLLAEPDVLLLDEPTNHLDLRSTEWLEGFLRGYRGTVLVVSHDRVFLERLADHILHLDDGTATPYTGGYDAFLDQREERRALQQKEYERQQAHIARTEDFIRRNLAGQKTKQAKSRRTLLARMERVDQPTDEGRAMGVRFGGSARSGGTVLRLDGVTHAFGSRTLFRAFRAEVMRGERIAIVGPNGSGKSTLMKAIAGAVRPSGGEIVHGAGVRAAYYRQDFTHLDPALRVWEAVNQAAPSLGMPALRDHLARFLFTNDEIEAQVGDLSGGEQARVALARITLEKANLLLLDEPTNHLDIVSREVLEDALDHFEGAVLLISHDRALLGALATRVWAFEPDADGVARIHDYPGGFDDWSEHVAARAVQPVREAASPSIGAAARAAEKGAAAGGGLSKNEIRRREQQLARLEMRIAEIEARTAAIESELADPALYAPGADLERVRALADERAALEAELEEKYEEWERAGSELVGV